MAKRKSKKSQNQKKRIDLVGVLDTIGRVAKALEPLIKLLCKAKILGVIIDWINQL